MFLSERHAGLSPDDSEKIIALLDHYHLPLVLPKHITTDTVMEKLARDKKFSAGAIRFVVLDALGSAKVINTVTADDLREAIEMLRTPLRPDFETEWTRNSENCGDKFSTPPERQPFFLPTQTTGQIGLPSSTGFSSVTNKQLHGESKLSRSIDRAIR